MWLEIWLVIYKNLNIQKSAQYEKYKWYLEDETINVIIIFQHD